MPTIAQTPPASKSRLWTGRILTTFAVAFLAFDGVMKLVKPPVVVKATLELGYPESSIVGIGVLLLVCTLIHLIPRTSILGAVLLTGYLGGAVATNVRVGNPLFSHVLFPVYVAAMVWGGLYLRDTRLRTLVSSNN
jgi:hypothetical protein